MSENLFERLSQVDVSKWVEKKNGFGYLSWAKAQELLLKEVPQAKIIVKTFGEFDLPYLKTELGYFVWVIVDIDGYIQGKPFPVLDGANRPLGAEYWSKKDNKYLMNRQPTSFDINNSIQRATAKAIAEHGLGISVFLGEDLKQYDNNTNNTTSFQSSEQDVKTLISIIYKTFESEMAKQFISKVRSQYKIKDLKELSNDQITTIKEKLQKGA